MTRAILCTALLIACACFPTTLPAASAAQQAQGLAVQLRDQAGASVTAAQTRLAAARNELASARATAASIRLARDVAADQVAAEAVAIARQGLDEATQLLARAEALLAARTRLVDEVRAAGRQGGTARGYVIPLQGAVERHGGDGAVVRDAGPTLQAGETVKVAPGGRAKVFLEGGRTEVVLEQNSDFTLARDDDDGLLAALGAGIARLRVEMQNRMRRFEVRTPAAVCAVRGTEFSLDVTPDRTRVEVFEGIVTMTAAGGDEVEVRTGETREFVTAGDPAPAAPSEQSGGGDDAFRS